MSITDNVAKYILEILARQNGEMTFKRGDLAKQLGCVPSQINYCIESRFTQDLGFLVDSRKGGQGYVRIRQFNVKVKTSKLKEILQKLETAKSVDKLTCEITLNYLINRGEITEKDYILADAILDDETLKEVPLDIKDEVRLSILKKFLLTIYEKNLS